MPEELAEIRRFLARLPADIAYRGERIPRLRYMALLALMRPKRRQPCKEEKVRIMEEQQHKCAMCGDPCRKGITPEFDHLARREMDVGGLKKNAGFARFLSCSAHV